MPPQCKSVLSPRPNVSKLAPSCGAALSGCAAAAAAAAAAAGAGAGAACKAKAEFGSRKSARCRERRGFLFGEKQKQKSPPGLGAAKKRGQRGKERLLVLVVFITFFWEGWGICQKECRNQPSIYFEESVEEHFPLFGVVLEAPKGKQISKLKGRIPHKKSSHPTGVGFAGPGLLVSGRRPPSCFAGGSSFLGPGPPKRMKPFLSVSL